ncbi:MULTISPECIES: hypothetical protein, partial [unclassified Frankia]|uniref:hypothetical protein n=1 Tax=unclassified Frankia TaxID=2632575 RepID=UPI002AD4A2F2
VRYGLTTTGSQTPGDRSRGDPMPLRRRPSPQLQETTARSMDDVLARLHSPSATDSDESGEKGRVARK